MKIIILSTILLFCILPVANANKGNIKIKFIRELVTSSNKSRSIDQEQSLSGFGVEFYKNLSQDSCPKVIILIEQISKLKKYHII